MNRFRNKYLFLLFLRAPFEALRTWVLANLLKDVFGALAGGGAAWLTSRCIVYGLLCIVLFCYNGIVWSRYAAFSAEAEASLQKRMMKSILEMPYQKVSEHRGSDWLTRMNSDIHGVFVLMNGPLTIPHAVVSVLNIVLASLLLFQCEVRMFVAVWVFVIPHLLLNYLVVSKGMPGRKEKSQKALADCTGTLKPLIAEAESVRIYQAEEMLLEQCRASSKKLMDIHMKMQIRTALGNGLGRLFGMAGYLVLIFMGYGKMNTNRMSFAELVYLFQLRGGVLLGVMMLATCISNIKMYLACAKRVGEICQDGRCL